MTKNNLYVVCFADNDKFDEEGELAIYSGMESKSFSTIQKAYEFARMLDNTLEWRFKCLELKGEMYCTDESKHDILNKVKDIMHNADLKREWIAAVKGIAEEEMDKYYEDHDIEEFYSEEDKNFMQNI